MQFMYAIANVIYGLPVEVDFDLYYEKDEDIKNELPSFEKYFGEAQVFILWSSS